MDPLVGLSAYILSLTLYCVLLSSRQHRIAAEVAALKTIRAHDLGITQSASAKVVRANGVVDNI